MSEIKWIKITTGMFEDDKFDFIYSLPDADAIIIIWIRILTLAGKCNAGGYVMLTEKIAYTEEMLANRFKKPLNTVKLALETFKKLDMIEMDEGAFYISNWEKHQNIDGMEKVREQGRIRKQKERERKRLAAAEVELLEPPSQDSHVTGHSASHPIHATDIDKELDIDKEKEIKNKRPSFDDFWIVYPRRVRKQDSVKTWEKVLKEKANPQDIITAAINYAVYCKQRGTLPDYILHPPTFLNKERWKDYLKAEGVSSGEQGPYEFGGGPERTGYQQMAQGNKGQSQSAGSKRRYSEDEFDSLGIGQ